MSASLDSRMVGAARLATLLSPYTGLATAVADAALYPDDARLSYVYCQSSNTPAYRGETAAQQTFNGSAAALTRAGAQAAALGEVVERYCGSGPPPTGSVRFGSSNGIDVPVVPAHEWQLFHPRQFEDPELGFEPFTDDTPVAWVPAENLSTGAIHYVPAQYVQMHYRRRPDEPRITYSTSSGLACGPTKTWAMISALCEVVERDAFMLTWYGAERLRRVTWKRDSALGRLERKHFAPARVQHYVVDLSVFSGIPTAAAFVIDPNPSALRPALVSGSASAPTMMDAVRKALVEAYHCRVWARELLRRRGDETFKADFTDLVEFGDHVYLHARADSWRPAEFLYSSPDTIDIEDCHEVGGRDPQDVLENMIDRLSARGIDLYSIEHTTEDVRDAGLCVMRVLSPQLCKLNSGHRQRFLAGPRLYHAAFGAGLRSSPLTYDTINHLPHPFP